jgi:hypothetical protein
MRLNLMSASKNTCVSRDRQHKKRWQFGWLTTIRHTSGHKHSGARGIRRQQGPLVHYISCNVIRMGTALLLLFLLLLVFVVIPVSVYRHHCFSSFSSPTFLVVLLFSRYTYCTILAPSGLSTFSCFHFNTTAFTVMWPRASTATID